MSFASTPEPPYYVACFSSQLTENRDGYSEMAYRMLELAKTQDGYLGHESLRNANGFGITNSFWRDEEALKKWRENTHHMVAQKLGQKQWYEAFHIRIARVERENVSKETTAACASRLIE